MDTQQHQYDEGLLRDAKGGDGGAFETFYQRHKKQIFNYVYRLTANYYLAEELTQDAFIKAYTHLSTYNPRGKALSWLYTIATNLIKNAKRDRIKRGEVSLEAAITTDEGSVNLLDIIPDLKDRPDTALSKSELHKQIQTAVDSLSFRYKQVLVLCDLQGYSYQQAGELLGCKAATVGSRLFRARAKIAKMLRIYYKKEFKK